MNLQEAIVQLVSLGEHDPAVIAEKVRKRTDDRWLANELLALADEILADIARHELGRVRRSSELAIRPGDPMTSAQMKIAKAWVPRVGWKPAGQLTVEDLLARARWYDQFAEASRRRAQWCREVVDLMKQEAVAKLQDLTCELPPLPPVLEELSA